MSTLFLLIFSISFIRFRWILLFSIKKGFPFISFTRFVPKSGIIVPKTMQDLKQEKVVTFVTESSKIKNQIKFALEKLIRMGIDVPHNRIFRKSVIEK